RLLLDLPQVLLVAKTFGVDLIDVFGARGPRREPAVVGNHLDAAERLAVAGGGAEGGADRFAGEFGDAELVGRQRLQQVPLPGVGRRVDPLIERHAEFTCEAVEDLAGIALGPRGSL